MQVIVHRGFVAPVVLCVTALLLSSCGGGSSPTSPTPTGPVVSSVAPNSGTTLGGTTVTVTGRNFAAGALVTIGGAAATNVTVQSTSSMTVITPSHAAGAADVVVSFGGRSGTLPSGFTFVAPAVTPNTPPVVSTLVARGARKNEPVNFADLSEEVTVTATVQDKETALDKLVYEWSAPAGTFTGIGASVKWRAPASYSTPGLVRLTLTVIERYDTTNEQGLPITGENRATSGIDVRVHDSVKEVRDLAVQFLIDFSQQKLAPAEIIRNFSDSCPGKKSELTDVADNQAKRTITSYDVQNTPPVDISFDDFCRYRDRFGDACAYVSVRWNSTIKADGRKELAVGTDQVNAIYEGSRWWLCDSDFEGTTSTGLRFKK